MSSTFTNADMNGAVTVSITLDRRDVAVPIPPLPLVYHVPRSSLLYCLYPLVVSNFLPFVVPAKEQYGWLLRPDRKTCSTTCNDEPLLWHFPVGLIADAIEALRERNKSPYVLCPLNFTATCSGTDHKNIDCANNLDLIVGQLVKQSLAVLFGTTRAFIKLNLQHTNTIRNGVLIAKSTAFADIPRIPRIGETSKFDRSSADQTCYSDPTSDLTGCNETHALLCRNPTSCAGTVEEAVKNGLFFDHGKVLDTMSYIRTQIYQEMGGDANISAFPIALHWLSGGSSGIFSDSTVRFANVPQEFRDNSSSRDRYSLYLAVVQAISGPFLRRSIIGDDCSCEQEFVDIMFSEKRSRLTGVVDHDTNAHIPFLHGVVYAALTKKILVDMKQQKSVDCSGVKYPEILQWLSEDEDLMRSTNELKVVLDSIHHIEYEGLHTEEAEIQKASEKLSQLLSDAQEKYYQRYSNSVGSCPFKTKPFSENSGEDSIITNPPQLKTSIKCGNWRNFNSFLRCYHIIESLRASVTKSYSPTVQKGKVTSRCAVRVVIQGIDPHLDTPIMWLFQHYTSSDMKLHILMDVRE